MSSWILLDDELLGLSIKSLGIVQRYATLPARVSGHRFIVMNGVVSRNTIIVFLSVSAAHAQGTDDDLYVYWNIDPNVKSCSMVIDPDLTQAQWNTFTKQVGAILGFKSMAPAETLGKMNFSISIDDSYTPIEGAKYCYGWTSQGSIGTDMIQIESVGGVYVKQTIFGVKKGDRFIFHIFQL